MIDDVQKIDLSRHDLDMIESALHTQEKILTVQSRAGGNDARARLNNIKGLMRRLRRQSTDTADAPKRSWSFMARSLFI